MGIGLGLNLGATTSISVGHFISFVWDSMENQMSLKGEQKSTIHW